MTNPVRCPSCREASPTVLELGHCGFDDCRGYVEGYERALLERDIREIEYHLPWFESESRRLWKAVEVPICLHAIPPTLFVGNDGKIVTVETPPLPAHVEAMRLEWQTAYLRLMDLHAWRARAVLDG